MCQPVELLAQRVLATLLSGRGHAVTLDALLDVGGVAAVERLDLSVVDLPHVLADLVQEPAVVRHHEKGARALGPAGLEVVGKPADGVHVQVVGGLVHEDNVPGAHEEPCQVAAASLTTGERANGGVPAHVS